MQTVSGYSFSNFMIKTIAFIIWITVVSTTVFGQSSGARTMLVIDSIPFPLDRDQSFQISEEDLSFVSVITQPDSLIMLGFPAFDSVTYIFTKEYVKRPDSI